MGPDHPPVACVAPLQETNTKGKSAIIAPNKTFDCFIL
jgi:hypothetical protein